MSHKSERKVISCFLIILFCSIGECVKFLLDQAKSLSLPSNVYTFHVGKPVVVITWEGKEPSLPSILLNSHTDVVPVTPVSILLFLFFEDASIVVCRVRA